MDVDKITRATTQLHELFFDLRPKEAAAVLAVVLFDLEDRDQEKIEMFLGGVKLLTKTLQSAPTTPRDRSRQDRHRDIRSS